VKFLEKAMVNATEGKGASGKRERRIYIELVLLYLQL